MTGVHLVGSIALGTADEVFETVGRTIGKFIERCPDGEVGGRRQWITWQWPLLRGAYFLEPAEMLAVSGVGLPPLRIKPGVEDSEIEFGELGYSREARTSYQDFLRARELGFLSPSTRFQVSLPTPLAVIRSFIISKDVARILPVYERAMLAEIGRICAAIPHNDLAIQWDVCFELIQLDGRLPNLQPPADAEKVFADEFARLCAPVPVGVELGFHLCYGDLDGKHGIEPIDLAKAVEMANIVVASAGRPVGWVHMPVPIDRHDDGYFAPLQNLELTSQTTLFLGVVHLNDGTEGTVKRMKAAGKYAQGFGIATECGLGRARSADMVRDILKVHAEAAEAFST